MKLRLVLVALLLSLVAAPVAVSKDVLPKDRLILFWSPAEQQVGYRRMEDVYEVSTIRRGARVHRLPKAKGVEPAISFTFMDKTYTPESWMAEDRISGLLILKDGKILMEKYGQGRKPADRWTSFSVAKSVTSILIGAAIKDGKIASIDDPVIRYIPELAGSAYEGVSVRHLLTMTSGVRWNEDYQDPNSDVAKADLEPPVPGKNTIVTYMSRLPRQYPPGTRFVYKTGETDLAGILLTRAVGKSMAQYASEKIWRPYGMEKDAIWMLDSVGHERGGCCMSMTLRDYGRLGQFMLDGGAGQLPDGWIATSTTNQLPPPTGGGRAQQYGYFWWMAQGGFSAQGIFGQMIYVNPAQKIVIVTNSAWPNADGGPPARRRAAFLNAAVAALTAPPAQAPR